MALKLTKQDTRVFAGVKGAECLLGISVAKVAAGAPADIVSITYNGITTNAAPFKFKVASGDHGLVVVYVSTPGTRVTIEEVDTASATNKQPLAHPFFDPSNPSVVILIQGS